MPYKNKEQKNLIDYFIEKEKQMRKRTMTKRFYVGSRNMAAHFFEHGTNEDNVGTLEAATEHAKQCLEENQNLEGVFVVEIVRVVRRESRPVIVESTR